MADRAAGGLEAAKLFIDLAEASPTKPVGLATGGTMAGVYANLQQLDYRPGCEAAFALDEYLDIDPASPNSYLFELQQSFARALDWDGTIHAPGQGEYRGEGGSELFEQRLTELGPVSVQLLGLGTNGHIAFNEPGSDFDSRTRVVELHPQTRADNARFFESEEQMPTHATTQGLATIKQASNLLLLVFGENKKPALTKALSDPDPLTPLAALANHEGLILITDLGI